MMSNRSKRPNYSIQHINTSCDFPAKQSGFSLLELLIGLLIFAIGFLGVASLQHVSIKLTHDSALQNTVFMLSNTLIEELRATRGSANLAEWQERVKKELPQGNASLTDHGNEYSLKIQWQESQHSEAPSNLQTFQTTFKIHP